MITYVDTSTLIKLLIDEAGSEPARQIWDGADALVTGRLTAVEGRATLAAAKRAGRLTASQHRAAVAELELLWSSLNVVEVTADIIERAGELADVHALRGYDAVHLAAALVASAELFTSADRRLCLAARTVGIHVLNPLEAPDVSPAPDAIVDPTRIVSRVTNPLADVMTADSNVCGIPLPADAQPDPERSGFVTTSSVGTIHDLAAFYRDWMAIDGWIFDADHAVDDPYDMEQRKLGGYFVQLFFVKPTTPPTTVGIIIGNADGKPGHKRNLTINIGRTPDDDLPRRSRQIGPNYA
jgi:uncharacterized protein